MTTLYSDETRKRELASLESRVSAVEHIVKNIPEQIFRRTRNKYLVGKWDSFERFQPIGHSKDFQGAKQVADLHNAVIYKIKEIT